MPKLMVECPKTGKLFFSGETVNPNNLKEIHLGLMKTTIVRCPHCGQDHDLKKEKLSLVPECPLCNSPARSDLCDDGNIYFFHCDICTDYFISRAAAKWINKYESRRKVVFSKNAAFYKDKTNVLAITLVGQEIHREPVLRNRYHCI